MVFELAGINKNFGSRLALSDVSMSVSAGEIISIIGPSGSGKTTLLKILAGLEQPDSGSLVFSRGDPLPGQIIMVFQDYVLFPHLTIFENVAFGLKAGKELKKNAIPQRVFRMLEYFGIKDEARKYPAQLSGGQRQRVAIARAMVLNPQVLLLDEPFANLDKNLKSETAAFIRETQKEFDVTTVTVTHDMEEAFLMSDRIGILLAGKLVQFDSVENVYFKPSDLEAARFLGPVNTIPNAVLTSLKLECEIPDRGLPVAARAEGMKIEAAADGEGTVVGRLFTGKMILYEVDVAGSRLKIYSLANSYKVGDRVDVTLTRSMSAQEPK